VRLREGDFGVVLRGLAAFAETRVVADFLATFADFVDVLAIVFTQGSTANGRSTLSDQLVLVNGQLGFLSRRPTAACLP
jgi:hypothetical protein